MSDVQIDPSGFGGAYARLNNSQTVVIDRLSFLHASVSVGAPSAMAVIGQSLGAPSFALYKALAICATADFQRGITLPSSYLHFEQTEKANLSYWVGMAMCKIVADNFLAVTWPIHTRLLNNLGLLRLRNPLSKSLPDLIGQDATGGWHVFEAKCRQRRKDNFITWKAQTRAVTLINQVRPATSSVTATFLVPEYCVDWQDPEPENGELGIEIEVKQTDVIRAYYAPYLDILAQAKGTSKDSDAIVYSPSILDPLTGSLYSLGAVRSVLEAASAGKAVNRMVAESSDKQYIGSDGIAIKSEVGR